MVSLCSVIKLLSHINCKQLPLLLWLSSGSELDCATHSGRNIYRTILKKVDSGHWPAWITVLYHSQHLNSSFPNQSPCDVSQVNIYASLRWENIQPINRLLATFKLQTCKKPSVILQMLQRTERINTCCTHTMNHSLKIRAAAIVLVASTGAVFPRRSHGNCLWNR